MVGIGNEGTCRQYHLGRGTGYMEPRGPKCNWRATLKRTRNSALPVYYMTNRPPSRPFLRAELSRPITKQHFQHPRRTHSLGSTRDKGVRDELVARVTLVGRQEVVARTNSSLPPCEVQPPLEYHGITNNSLHTIGIIHSKS
jgi:hypothetical protein